MACKITALEVHSVICFTCYGCSPDILNEQQMYALERPCRYQEKQIFRLKRDNKLQKRVDKPTLGNYQECFNCMLQTPLEATIFR